MHLAQSYSRGLHGVSRRQFLAATGTALSALALGSRIEAAEELAPPKFLLQWGQHGKEPGEPPVFGIQNDDVVRGRDIDAVKQALSNLPGRLAKRGGRHVLDRVLRRNPAEFGGDSVVAAERTPRPVPMAALICAHTV